MSLQRVQLDVTELRVADRASGKRGFPLKTFLKVWWYIGRRRSACYMLGPYAKPNATKLAAWINEQRGSKDAEVVQRTQRPRFHVGYMLGGLPSWVRTLLRRENNRIKRANAKLPDARKEEA